MEGLGVVRVLPGVLLTPSGHLAALSGRKAALGSHILALSAPPFPTMPAYSVKEDEPAGRHPWLGEEVLSELSLAEVPVTDASLLHECGCPPPAQLTSLLQREDRAGEAFELFFDQAAMASYLGSASPYLGSALGPLGPVLHWLACLHHADPLPLHILALRGATLAASFRGAPLAVSIAEDLEAISVVAPGLLRGAEQGGGGSAVMRVALVHAGREIEEELVALLARCVETKGALPFDLIACGSVVSGRVRTALASFGCVVVCAVPEKPLVELAELLGTGVFRTWKKALQSSFPPKATVHLHHSRHWATRDSSTVDVTPDQARDPLFHPIAAYLSVAPATPGHDHRTFLLSHPVDGLSDAAAASLHALIARSDAIRGRSGRAIPFAKAAALLSAVAEANGFRDRRDRDLADLDTGWGVLGAGAYGKWIDFDGLVEAVDAALLVKHQISITTLHLYNSDPIF